MKYLIALGLSALIAAPAQSSPVSVAGGDWSNIPLVHQTGEKRISADAIEKMEVAARGECAGAIQPARRIKMTIPFLIHFSPQGGVEQVVVKRLDCPTIEQVAGSAVLQLAKDGAYRPTGENQERWYRGEISFTSFDSH